MKKQAKKLESIFVEKVPSDEVWIVANGDPSSNNQSQELGVVNIGPWDITTIHNHTTKGERSASAGSGWYY